jgi:hypothetical protein
MDKTNELIIRAVMAVVEDALKDNILPLLESQKSSGEEPVRAPGRQVYGLKGIQELFHVSHKTAQIYKDGILKPAVRQNGRKIVVDADLALELFGAAHKKTDDR